MPLETAGVTLLHNGMLSSILSMLKSLTPAVAALAGTAAASIAILPAFGITIPLTPPPPVEDDKVAVKEVAPEPVEPRLVCKSCNLNEKIALSTLQEHGVTDRNALATVMGNIRQESTFVPNICEGGTRTGYYGCHSGGFGLIQWTSANRYRGLGSFASRYGGDPSTLHTQLHYMVNEPQWKRIEPHMMTPGKTIPQYMSYAYTWIGWGHHGYRTHYAYDYARRFTLEV